MMSVRISESTLNNFVSSASDLKDLRLVETFLSHGSQCTIILDKAFIENLQRLLDTVVQPLIPDVQHYEGIMAILKCLEHLCNQHHEEHSWDSIHAEFVHLICSCLQCITIFLDANQDMFTLLWISIVSILYTSSIKLTNMKNTMLKFLSLPLIDLAVSDKLTLVQFKECLRVVVHLLVQSDRELRKVILKNITNDLIKLFNFLSTCGDYEAQLVILETVLRFVTVPKYRNLFCKSFDNEEISENFVNISLMEFDVDCRKFLNTFNHAHRTGVHVFTIACVAVRLGEKCISKPKDPKYESFWIDFNLGSGNITILCDRRSLITKKQLSQDTEETADWEMLTIPNNIVRKVVIRFRVLKEDGTKVKELKLSLKQPCEASYDSSLDCVSQANDLHLLFECTSEMEELEKTILPSMFKYSYQENMEKSHTPYWIKVKTSISTSSSRLPAANDSLTSVRRTMLNSSESYESSVSESFVSFRHKRKASMSKSVTCKSKSTPHKLFKPLECVISRSPRNPTSPVQENSSKITPENTCDSMEKKATSNADGNKAVQTQSPGPLNKATKTIDESFYGQLPNGSVLHPTQNTMMDNPAHISRKINVISENEQRVELGQLKTADNIVGLCKKVKLFKPSLNSAEDNLSTPESSNFLLNSNAKCSLAHQKPTPTSVINGESLKNMRSTNTDFDQVETTKNNLNHFKANETTDNENINSLPEHSKKVNRVIRQPNDQNGPTKMRNINNRITNSNAKFIRSPKTRTDLGKTTSSHHINSLPFMNVNVEGNENETSINAENTKRKRNVKKTSVNPPKNSLQSSSAKPNKGSTRRNSKKVNDIQQNIINSKLSPKTEHGMFLRSKQKSSRQNMKSNESTYGPTMKEKGRGRNSTFDRLNFSVVYNEDLSAPNCDKSAMKRKLFSLNTGVNLLEGPHATGSSDTENSFPTSAIGTEKKLTTLQNLELHKETVRPHAPYSISKSTNQKISRWEIKFQHRTAKSRSKLHQSAKTAANAKSVYSDLDSDVDYGIYHHTNKDRELVSSTKKDTYEIINESEFEHVRLQSTVSQKKTGRKQQGKGNGSQKKGNGSKGVQTQAEKKSFVSFWGDEEEKPDILRCGTETADRRDNVENAVGFVNETYFPNTNDNSKNESFPPLIVEYENDKSAKNQTVLSSTLESDISKEWSGYETAGDKGIINLTKDICNNTASEAKPKQPESNITKNSDAVNIPPTGNSIMVDNKLGCTVTELLGNTDLAKVDTQMTKKMKANLSNINISCVTESASALQQFDSPVIINTKEESNNLQRKIVENSVSTLTKRNDVNCDSAIDDTHLPTDSHPVNNQAKLERSVPGRQLIRNNSDNTSLKKRKEVHHLLSSKENVLGLHNDSLDHSAKEKWANTSGDKFEIIEMTSYSSKLTVNDHPKVHDATSKNVDSNPEVQKSAKIKAKDNGLDLNSDKHIKTKESSQNVFKNKENIYGLDPEKITDHHDLEGESIIEINHKDTGTSTEKRLKKNKNDNRKTNAEVGKKELCKLKNKNKIQLEGNIITEISDRMTGCKTEISHVSDGGSEEMFKELLKDKNMESKSANKLLKNRKVQNKKKHNEEDFSDQEEEEIDLQNHSSKLFVTKTNQNERNNEIIENLALNTTAKKTSKDTDTCQNDKSERKEEGYHMDDNIDKYFTEQEFTDTGGQTCPVVAPLKPSHKESRNLQVIDNISLDTQDKLFPLFPKAVGNNEDKISHILAERNEQTRKISNYRSKFPEELMDVIYKNNDIEVDFADDNTDIIPCSREQVGSSVRNCKRNISFENGKRKSKEQSSIPPTSTHNKSDDSQENFLQENSVLSRMRQNSASKLRESNDSTFRSDKKFKKVENIQTELKNIEEETIRKRNCREAVDSADNCKERSYKSIAKQGLNTAQLKVAKKIFENIIASTDKCLNEKKENHYTKEQHRAETAGEEFVNSDEKSVGSMIDPSCPSLNNKKHRNPGIENMQAVAFVDRVKSKMYDHGLETYNVDNNLRCSERCSLNDTENFGMNWNGSKFTTEESHLTLDMKSSAISSMSYDKQTHESESSKISHTLSSDRDESENICKPTDKQFVISNVKTNAGISLIIPGSNKDVIDCDSRENTISQFQKKRDKCKRKLVWSETTNVKKDLKNREKDICKRRKISAEFSYSSADSFISMFSDDENNEERNSLKKPQKKFNSSPFKAMREQGEKRKCSVSRLQFSSAKRNMLKTFSFNQAAASSEKTLHFAEGSQPRSSLLSLQTMLSEGLKLKLKCLNSFSQRALEATVLDFKNCCIEDQSIRKLKMNGNVQDIAKKIDAIQASVTKTEEMGEKIFKMYQYAKGIATHNEKWIKTIEEGLLQLRQEEEKFRNLMEEDKENMAQHLCSQQSKLNHCLHNIMKLQLEHETKNVMARVKARFLSLLQR